MMPLALGDSVWIAGIAATQVVALAIIVPLMAIYLERVKKAIEKAADEAAVKVKEVKVTLEDSTGVVNEKLDTIAKTTGENTKTTDKIHTLVNSAMGAQLRVAALALRRIASATDSTTEDKVAAEVAENAYREHEMKQKVVDEGAAKA